MKLKDWLVPHEEKFFDLLEEQAEIVVEGARAFVEMCEKYDDVRSRKRVVKEIEHKGDLKAHDIHAALNATFITPIDREDIASLVGALDDILDYTWATANRMFLYEVTSVPKELAECARILHDQTILVRDALKLLREPSKRDEIRAKLVEIHALENRADELTNAAKADLFRQDDVKFLIKMKDVYEHIETATDKCEDAADSMRDILVKHA